MAIAVHWQDADSSSEKAVKKLHPDAKVMKCLGHVGRAHNNQLKLFQSKKQVTSGFINRHKGKYPDIATLKCCCQGKNHKKGCLWMHVG